MAVEKTVELQILSDALLAVVVAAKKQGLDLDSLESEAAGLLLGDKVSGMDPTYKTQSIEKINIAVKEGHESWG